MWNVKKLENWKERPIWKLNFVLELFGSQPRIQFNDCLLAQMNERRKKMHQSGAVGVGGGFSYHTGLPLHPFMWYPENKQCWGRLSSMTKPLRHTFLAEIHIDLICTCPTARTEVRRNGYKGSFQKKVSLRGSWVLSSDSNQADFIILVHNFFLFPRGG